MAEVEFKKFIESVDQNAPAADLVEKAYLFFKGTGLEGKGELEGLSSSDVDANWKQGDSLAVKTLCKRVVQAVEMSAAAKGQGAQMPSALAVQQPAHAGS